MLYDQNYLDINKENKNNIINNSNNLNGKNDKNNYKANNENEKNNMYYDEYNMIKFSQIEKEKEDINNKNINSNKKEKYIPLNEDSYYNINEI